MLTPLVSFVEKRISDAYSSATPIVGVGAVCYVVARIASTWFSGISPTTCFNITAGAAACAVMHTGLQREVNPSPISSPLENLVRQVGFRWGQYLQKDDVVQNKSSSLYLQKDGVVQNKSPSLSACLENLYSKSYSIAATCGLIALFNRYILPLSMRSDTVTALTLLTAAVHYTTQPFCEQLNNLYTFRQNITRQAAPFLGMRGSSTAVAFVMTYALIPLSNQTIFCIFLTRQAASFLGMRGSFTATAIAFVMTYASMFIAKLLQKKPIVDVKSTPVDVISSLQSLPTKRLALATFSTYTLNRWVLPSHLQSDRALFLTLLATAVYYGMASHCEEADKQSSIPPAFKLANRVVSCGFVLFQAAHACKVLAPHRITNLLALSAAFVPIIHHYREEQKKVRNFSMIGTQSKKQYGRGR